jgi:hypothetical protein
MLARHIKVTVIKTGCTGRNGGRFYRYAIFTDSDTGCFRALWQQTVKGLSMKLPLFFWVFVFISSMGPFLEAGEIYQWIDKDGVQHFTDGPPPPGAQIVEGLSETPAIEPPANTGATAPKDAGRVEGEENSPPDLEDTGTVDGGENSPTDREEYWRRKGWESGSTEREDPGAVEGGENGPNDRGEPGAVDGGQNAPIPERKID